jgi:hypothetical protein
MFLIRFLLRSSLHVTNRDGRLSPWLCYNSTALVHSRLLLQIHDIDSIHTNEANLRWLVHSDILLLISWTDSIIIYGTTLHTCFTQI